MKTVTRAALLAFLALTPGIALATTVLKLDNAQMSARASTIIHGEVTHLSAGQVPGSSMIYTEVRVRVAETWKGQANATFTFRQPGGILNGRGVLIPGAARFRVGEEVVLFVDKPDPRTGCAFTIGLAQGKFRVVQDPATGQKLVRRALGDLDLVDHQTLKPIPAPKPTAKQSLDDLRAQVRAALSKLGGK